MLLNSAAVPLSGKTHTFVPGIIRRHRVSIGHIKGVPQASTEEARNPVDRLPLMTGVWGCRGAQLEA
jgi:hypothetical protein